MEDVWQPVDHDDEVRGHQGILLRCPACRKCQLGLPYLQEQDDIEWNEKMEGSIYQGTWVDSLASRPV